MRGEERKAGEVRGEERKAGEVRGEERKAGEVRGEERKAGETDVTAFISTTKSRNEIKARCEQPCARCDGQQKIEDDGVRETEV